MNFLRLQQCLFHHEVPSSAVHAPGHSQTGGLARSSLVLWATSAAHTCRCGQLIFSLFACCPSLPFKHFTSNQFTEISHLQTLPHLKNLTVSKSFCAVALCFWRIFTDIPQVYTTSHTMDYQAPAPAAGGRGCYNCKTPIFASKHEISAREDLPPRS